jgi:glycerol uptake facilitator-like aquaporin
MIRRIAAELLGTGFLVFFGADVAAGLHRLLYPEPEPESLASGDIPPPIAG